MTLDTIIGFLIAMLIVVAFLLGMTIYSTSIQDKCDKEIIFDINGKTYICKEQA